MKYSNQHYSFSFMACCFILAMTSGFTVICSSCHTEKKIMKTPPVAQPENKAAARPEKATLSSGFILRKLKENTIPYHTFSAYAKLDITTPHGKQGGIATYIRMQKDSAIWISVRPILGIELIRVLITPDSVKMINFFKKTITARSTDSLQQLFHIPFDFKALQNLIVGNPPVLTEDNDELKPDSADNGIIFSCQGPALLCSYLIDRSSYLLLKNTLLQKDASGEARKSEESFDGYLQIEDHPFSTKRHLVIEAGTQTTADIKFSRVEFDKSLNFPFPEADNFRRE